MKKLILLMICIAPFRLLAQNMVSGTVYDYETKTFPLQDVTVRNLNSKQMVTTKAAGQFSIAAKTGDILELTMPGYHADSLYLVDLSPKKIYLPASSTALKEVNIQSAKVSPYLNVKPDSNVKSPARVSTDGLAGKKNNDRAGGVIFSLGYGKYKREQEKIRQLEERDSIETEIRLNFNEKTVNELTRLKGQELKDFIAMYKPSVARVKSERPFNYSYYIAEAHQAWLKLPADQRRLPSVPKLKRK